MILEVINGEKRLHQLVRLPKNKGKLQFQLRYLNIFIETIVSVITQLQTCKKLTFKILSYIFLLLFYFILFYLWWSLTLNWTIVYEVLKKQNLLQEKQTIKERGVYMFVIESKYSFWKGLDITSWKSLDITSIQGKIQREVW